MNNSIMAHTEDPKQPAGTAKRFGLPAWHITKTTLRGESHRRLAVPWPTRGGTELCVYVRMYVRTYPRLWNKFIELFSKVFPQIAYALRIEYTTSPFAVQFIVYSVCGWLLLPFIHFTNKYSNIGLPYLHIFFLLCIRS